MATGADKEEILPIPNDHPQAATPLPPKAPQLPKETAVTPQTDPAIRQAESSSPKVAQAGSADPLDKPPAGTSAPPRQHIIQRAPTSPPPPRPQQKPPPPSSRGSPGRPPQPRPMPRGVATPGLRPGGPLQRPRGVMSPPRPLGAPRGVMQTPPPRGSPVRLRPPVAVGRGGQVLRSPQGVPLHQQVPSQPHRNEGAIANRPPIAFRGGPVRVPPANRPPQGVLIPLRPPEGSVPVLGQSTLAYQEVPKSRDGTTFTASGTVGDGLLAQNGLMERREEPFWINVMDRRVVLSSEKDKRSLYSLCREWVLDRHIPPEDESPKVMHQTLPRPLSKPMEEQTSAQNQKLQIPKTLEEKKLDEEPSPDTAGKPREETSRPDEESSKVLEIDFTDSSVANLSGRQVLGHHMDKFKASQKRCREERHQRLDRYKHRVALLLVPRAPGESARTPRSSQQGQ